MDKYTYMEVKDLFDIDILKNSKVLSGNSGLNRKITKINVMEVPDIVDWVTPGEFLLTTAYSFKDDLQMLNKLIPMLNEKGLAGLGVKTKRYVEEIPTEIINLANELGFPIIEIPIEVSYSEIITSVLSEIINRQTNILTKINNFHNRLVRVMLKGGSLYEIANAIHESVENSVAISEDIFKSNVVICNEEDRDEIEKIMVRENNNNKNTLLRTDKRLNHYTSIETINGREVQRVDIPICIEEEHYGFLYIWQDKKILSQVELSVIESSISIIALDLVKKLSIFEIENKHRIEFFDNLLSQDEKKYNEAIERARLFDFDVKLYYTSIVVKFKNIEQSVRLTPINTNYIQKIHEKLISIIDKISKHRKEKIIYANKSDRLIILCGKNNMDEKTKKELIEFCEMIYSYAEKESIASNISVGIGRTYETSNLSKSYMEANRASDNSKDNNNNKPVHYDDLGIYRILSYEELKPELYQFYKEILEPLVKYDTEKDSELIETLKKYFECGGNLKKISQEMYIHYNTIIYRMQRIKEIIGIDFENHNELLNVQICLKVYDIMKNEKK